MSNNKINYYNKRRKEIKKNKTLQKMKMNYNKKIKIKIQKKL